MHAFCFVHILEHNRIHTLLKSTAVIMLMNKPIVFFSDRDEVVWGGGGAPDFVSYLRKPLALELKFRSSSRRGLGPPFLYTPLPFGGGLGEVFLSKERALGSYFEAVETFSGLPLSLKLDREFSPDPFADLSWFLSKFSCDFCLTPPDLSLITCIVAQTIIMSEVLHISQLKLQPTIRHYVLTAVTHTFIQGFSLVKMKRGILSSKNSATPVKDLTSMSCVFSADHIDIFTFCTVNRRGVTESKPQSMIHLTLQNNAQKIRFI